MLSKYYGVITPGKRLQNISYYREQGKYILKLGIEITISVKKEWYFQHWFLYCWVELGTEIKVPMLIFGLDILKGHGHDYGQIWFFYSYCLKCFSNLKAFLMNNQNLNNICRVISKIQSSKFLAMQTQLVPCFYLHWL